MSQPPLQPLILSIVVADPTGGDRLKTVVAALRDLRLSLRLEVIGAVGGLTSAGLASLQQAHPLVTILPAGKRKDLGTLYGLGAAPARGRYLLLLDGTAMPDRSTIEGMIQFMEKGQWVGAVGPRLVAPSGQEHPSSRRFPTVASALAESLGGRVATAPAPRIQNPFDRQVTTPKEVDAVGGGCWMIKRQAFSETGAWDAGYAPGGESLDWCRRARLKGWSVFYHPGLAARLEGEIEDDPRVVASDLASACRFIWRYHGPLDLLALKLLLALASLRALLYEGGAFLIPGGHRPHARHAFTRAWYVMGAILRPRRRRVA